jgi:hypothetical protein
MHFTKEEHIVTLTVQSVNLKNQKRSVNNEIFLHHKETKTTWPTITARDCWYVVTRDVSKNRARSIQTISKKTRVAPLPKVAPFLPLPLIFDSVNLLSHCRLFNSGRKHAWDSRDFHVQKPVNIYKLVHNHLHRTLSDHININPWYPHTQLSTPVRNQTSTTDMKKKNRRLHTKVGAIATCRLIRVAVRTNLPWVVTKLFKWNIQVLIIEIK